MTDRGLACPFPLATCRVHKPATLRYFFEEYCAKSGWNQLATLRPGQRGYSIVAHAKKMMWTEPLRFDREDMMHVKIKVGTELTFTKRCHYIAEFYREVLALEKLRGRSYIVSMISFSGQAINMVQATGDLFHLIRSSQLSMTDKLYLAAQMVRAVLYLHADNIAHGDLKLGNFLYDLMADGRYHVRLCDFGSSSPLNAHTPNFCDIVTDTTHPSPEMVLFELLRIKSRRTVDGKESEVLKLRPNRCPRLSDYFALGQTLLNLFGDIVDESKEAADPEAVWKNFKTQYLLSEFGSLIAYIEPGELRTMRRAGGAYIADHIQDRVSHLPGFPDYMLDFIRGLLQPDPMCRRLQFDALSSLFCRDADHGLVYKIQAKPVARAYSPRYRLRSDLLQYIRPAVGDVTVHNAFRWLHCIRECSSTDATDAYAKTIISIVRVAAGELDTLPPTDIANITDAVIIPILANTYYDGTTWTRNAWLQFTGVSTAIKVFENEYALLGKGFTDLDVDTQALDIYMSSNGDDHWGSVDRLAANPDWYSLE